MTSQAIGKRFNFHRQLNPIELRYCIQPSTFDVINYSCSDEVQIKSHLIKCTVDPDDLINVNRFLRGYRRHKSGWLRSKNFISVVSNVQRSCSCWDKNFVFVLGGRWIANWVSNGSAMYRGAWGNQRSR